MFFYLSFLRPPPSRTAPSGTFLITPQVANDLRTELFTGTLDIYFLWSQVVLATGSTAVPPAKPFKLTTWRESSAYKGIPVPVPRDVREGQFWRLILSAQAHGEMSIDLSESGIGNIPFPVMSVPILFSARGSKGAPKQEQIERAYEFLVSPNTLNTEPLSINMKITEQTSFDLDKKIWDSGIGLSSWLVDLRNGTGNTGKEISELTSVRNMLFSTNPRRILELGAGTGIVALTLAAIRSLDSNVSSDKNNLIFTTDLESAMPLLEHNIKSNNHLFPHNHPLPCILDWDNEDLPDYIQSEPKLDVIIMADVTYNTASFPSLVRTLSKLMKLDSTPPMVILGYKERDVAERALWDMTQDIGITFEKAGDRKGAGGAPVEIWINTQ